MGSKLNKTKQLFKSLVKIQNSHFSVLYRSITSQQLTYTEFGEPSKVIRKEINELSKPKQNEVLVKILASPLNPADINTIEGKYPAGIKLPVVAGNECVAKIVELGENVKNFSVGDHVVTLTSNLGTWATYNIFPDKYIYKVPKTLGLVEAATLTVNPCTAYRMLKDFIKLSPGDVIVQNGGNSACAQNVIQLCRAFGYKSVNIVRDRPEINELKEYLTKLGASHVLTENEVRSTDLFKQISKPKLALNCVGGKSALNMLRHIGNNGFMVTYGGMSREPVTVPTSALIFKDIHIVGFWMTRWTKLNFDSSERFTMLNDLINLMMDNKLKGPAFRMIPFKDYQEGLENALNVQGFTGSKLILDFSQED